MKHIITWLMLQIFVWICIREVYANSDIQWTFSKCRHHSEAGLFRSANIW